MPDFFWYGKGVLLFFLVIAFLTDIFPSSHWIKKKVSCLKRKPTPFQKVYYPSISVSLVFKPPMTSHFVLDWWILLPSHSSSSSVPRPSLICEAPVYVFVMLAGKPVGAQPTRSRVDEVSNTVFFISRKWTDVLLFRVRAAMLPPSSPIFLILYSIVLIFSSSSIECMFPAYSHT